MAKRLAIPSKELQLHIVGAKESFKAPRLQRLSFNTDIPVTDVDEIGSASHVGQSKDTPNVTLTFSAFDVGVKIFSVLTGTDYTNFPVGGVDISSLGEMDAILYVKNSTANTYVKSAHAKRLQIRDFTFNYSVDGESSEDYTAVGSERRWLKNTTAVEKFTTPGSNATLTGTPLQLRNASYILSVISDGTYPTEVSGAPAAGEFSYNSGTKVLTLGTAYATQLLVIYHTSSAGTWADVSEPNMPVVVKGKDVKVSIVANDIPRVQSLTINGNLNVQPVREQGNRAIVGYQRQIPTVEGNITVLDTDTDLISLLTYGVLGSGIEWQPGEECTTATVPVKVIFYDPCEDQTEANILKTVYLDNITVVGDAYASNVNNNATHTFNWRSQTAHCKVYSGWFSG